VQDGINSISRPQIVQDVENAPDLKVDRGARSALTTCSFITARIKGIRRLGPDHQARRKIGLVGRSGAGKSTLVNLLLRFMTWKVDAF